MVIMKDTTNELVSALPIGVLVRFVPSRAPDENMAI